MISRIEIENFKSIQKLSLDLGRITVLIGENGAGKSNILEAIAFGSAAAANKLDHEFMAPRGIRMTEPKFMRPAFPGAAEGDICLRLFGDEEKDKSIQEFRLHPREDSKGIVWRDRRYDELAEILQGKVREDEGSTSFSSRLLSLPAREKLKLAEAAKFLAETQKALSALGWMIGAMQTGDEATGRISNQLILSDFMEFFIYSPENTPLRTFEDEAQLLPLGINGSGLFSHLKYLAVTPGHAEKLEEIIEKLSLIDWFEKFEIPRDLFVGERILHLRDRYLAEGALFDQRSANEGFLFLLFYFTLFISPSTPSFFAIDNIDASLNPKLCRALVKELVALAKKHNKQAILTTHNPAVLDGINLHDDEQRLFVVSRDDETGETQVSRVTPPKPLEDGRPAMRLSEAFMRGYIGGLPKNF